MQALADEQLHYYLNARGFSYELLSRIFLKEPNDQLLDVLKEGILNSFPFCEEHKLIEEGISDVEGFFKQNDCEISNKLNWDFTRMFIGPYKLKAPLWESAYINKERLLFQTETLLVRREYLKYRLLPVNFGSEADDHLGLELHYLYQLNEMMKESFEKNDIVKVNGMIEDQISFLNDHLLVWVPQLKEKIIEHAKYDFYKGIVKILLGFLMVDKLCLKELLKENQLQKC